MTFEEYLAGKVGIDIDKSAIQSILAERGIDENEDFEDISVKNRELCLADLYMWCATVPTISGTTRDADGGWSHQEGGAQLYAGDKEAFRRLARDIYSKYGLIVGKKVRMNSFGMKVWGSRKR